MTTQLIDEKPDWSLDELFETLDQATLVKEKKSSESFLGDTLMIEDDDDEAGRQRIANAESPFLELGVNIENFFALEVSLIKIFSVLTILAAAQVFVFAFKEETKQTDVQFSYLQKISFASFEQASIACSKSPYL